MGIFGWSMPAGCTGTPYDEVFAEELKAPELPENVTAFWVEGETIEIQRFHPDAEPETLMRFDYLGDDDLTEEQNAAAAAKAAAQKWEAYVANGCIEPILRIRMWPNEASPGWCAKLQEHGCKVTYHPGPFGRTEWLVKMHGEAINVIQGGRLALMTTIDNPTAKQREIVAALVSTGIAREV
ncbi:MAG: hypothetical protein AzoDbin1_04217 [Azoarcus sp.]|nr:hypothetical protein [Azoarcus sp.]